MYCADDEEGRDKEDGGERRGERGGWMIDDLNGGEKKSSK